MLFSVCLTGTAAAQDGSLAELLRSGNGQVTAAQAQAAAARQFARLDANHDGVVTQIEFVDDRMALFKQADSNGDGDGVLTRAEARAMIISRMHNRSGETGN